MGLKKKKNVLIIAVIVILCFTLYQLYFFSTLSWLLAENPQIRVYHSMESSNMEIVHVRTKHDKYINDNGVIRGVLLSNMNRYRPKDGDKFKCIMSHQTIPFKQVNDDYCDCIDGTDEPSTSACINGTFYCDNQRTNKMIALVSVPSSAVNDGICDCCDGSDEWLRRGKVLTQGSATLYRHLADHCPNIC